MARKKIETVEMGRGLAATLVLLGHVTKFYFGAGLLWSVPFLNNLFMFGFSGVEFFFVLSGYIMYQVHNHDFGRPDRLLRYIMRRIVRIYPLLWLVLALTVVLLSISVGSKGRENLTSVNIVYSALLVGPDPFKAVVATSWTLWHEMLFYTLFAIFIVRARLGAIVLGLWTAASVGITLLEVAPPWPNYLTAFVNLLFGFGIFCAWLLGRGRVRLPMLLLGVSVAVFLATGLAVDYIGLTPTLFTFLFGASSAGILTGLVQSEKDGAITAPRWLVQLGGASYSIYLTHPITIAAVARILKAIKASAYLPAPVGFLIFVAAGIGVGLGIHLLVEKPVTQFLNERVGRWKMMQAATSRLGSRILL